VSNNEEPAAVDLEAAIRGKVEKWREKLLDLGNRNPLINTSFNPSRGVIEVVAPSSESVWNTLAAGSDAGVDPMRFPWRSELVPPSYDEDLAERSEMSPEQESSKPREWLPSLEECRNSPLLKTSDILTEVSDKVLDRRLRTLESHAKLAMSEQGVQALYIVFGFLKWYESRDSKDPRWSPLMLVPVALSRSGTGDPWDLVEAEDDALENLCLRQRLIQDFSITLPPLPDINELEEPGARESFLGSVCHTISDQPEWEVVDRVAVGRFAFPKIAMWKDLGDYIGSVTNHPLCRSLAGDHTVPHEDSFGAVGDLPEPHQFDDMIPPGELKTILDSDSSQYEAVVAARKGVSFVLDGPPGTGKSQTIANIIADGLSDGKKVLFVSEKASALEVVKRRLDDNGLGDFCLECHSSKANRKSVLYELDSCLSMSPESYRDTSPKLKELQQTRHALNEYVRKLHQPRSPFGLSAFEVYGEIAKLNRLGLQSRSRCNLPDACAVDRETFDGWLRLLVRAADHTDVIRDHSAHPWRGCRPVGTSLSFADDLDHHLATLASIFDRISRCTAPLTRAELLKEVTPASLGSSQKLIKSSLGAPDIPAEWFAAPGDTSATILRHLAMTKAEEKNRAILHCYVVDVTSLLEDELLTPLASDAPQWSRRLKDLHSGSARDSASEHRQVLNDLSAVRRALDDLRPYLTELIEQLKIPLQEDLPLITIPKVVELSLAISDCGTMRPAWFDARQWPILLQMCEAATERLSEAHQISEQLSAGISPDRISALASLGGDLDSVRAAWNSIKNAQPEGTSCDIQSFGSQCHSVKEEATTVQTATESVWSGLGIGVDTQVTLARLRPVHDTVVSITEAGSFHASWSDVSTRNHIRTACEEAVAELTEASDIKDNLSDRMSHRAFKAAASNVATRGLEFRSWMKRLFGGFRAFHNDVGEFYKTTVPAKNAMLSDMQQLSVYHRRVEAVAATVAELELHLPKAFKSQEVGSWNALKDAVDASEPFFEVVGEVTGTGDADIAAVRIASEQMCKGLDQLDTHARKIDSSDRITHMSLPEVVCHFGDLAEAAQVVHLLITEASSIYAGPPPELENLLEDMSRARERQTLLENVDAAFSGNSESMPIGAVPADATTWSHIAKGVRVAQQLNRLVKVTSTMTDNLCQQGRIDLLAVSAAADAVDARQTKLTDAICCCEQRITLSERSDGQTAVQRNTMSAMTDTVESAIEDLSGRAAVLEELCGVLKHGCDVSVGDLPAHAQAVQQLKNILASLAMSSDQLAVWGIAGIHADDRNRATWLAEFHKDGRITPLMKQVASDKQVRDAVQQAAAELKAASSANLKASWKFLSQLFELEADVSTGITFMAAPVGQLATHLAMLRENAPQLEEWVKFARWNRDMVKAGFKGVVEELLSGSITPEETADLVSLRIHRELFDRIASTDRSIGEFVISAHEEIRDRFCQLDQWEIRAAAKSIREYQLGRSDRPRKTFTAAASSELGMLQREIAKKRKHLPLRRLFAEIAGVIQRLKPCIMMSPLSVSTLLDTEDIRFDVVIFDEASQVFPWDAMGAIYRGTQLIVAGDEKQMPPSNFFNRADIESDDEDDISDFESILSLCKSINMPAKRLRWHYRSRREPLIAFSNRHFYDGDLVTFPSALDGTGDAVRLELVSDGRWIDRKNLLEAARVTDLVLDHLKNCPQKSIGVIAFNQSQQRAIEDTIYDRRRTDAVVDALFSVDLPEPLFIKNLENVQGDERDVILLSMGYAKNDAGKFLKNFGPLSKGGGERRLNVAVTRAREQVVMVASVRAADMDLSGSKSQGAHLLKAYLEYAEKGVDALGLARQEIAGEVESPFEADVANELIRRGFEPVAQVGCGGFRLDLALKHPEYPGVFCLGIECDGATYHSSQTARDRDRIRQSVLEGLGWNIVRVWSTDWVRNPETQMQRIMDAYDAAVAGHANPKTNYAEFDDDDLEPEIVEPAPDVDVVATKTYANIDEVPSTDILERAQSILVQAGATGHEDLMRMIARDLGFSRLGQRIRERLDQQLAEEIRLGNLRRVGERITLTSADVSQR
jgi:very-short-patch-repair endonuclease